MRRLVVPALLACVGLAIVSATGCSGSSSNAGLLAAHQWKVTKLGVNGYTGSAPITSVFADGKLSGSTGINQYSATYDAQTGSSITIKLGPMTLVAGTPQAMAAEQQFTKALASAASYAVDEDSLTLFDANGVSVVVYTVLQPTPLVGTTWKATGINNGTQAVVSTLASASVTAQFGADGTVSGSGGVNRYRAGYTTSGPSIAIQAHAVTKLAGPADAMQQEAAYFSALAKAAKYTVDGTTLTLRDSSGATQVTYAAQ